jgi:hypothetical protein
MAGLFYLVATVAESAATSTTVGPVDFRLSDCPFASLHVASNREAIVGQQRTVVGGNATGGKRATKRRLVLDFGLARSLERALSGRPVRPLEAPSLGGACLYHPNR